MTPKFSSRLATREFSGEILDNSGESWKFYATVVPKHFIESPTDIVLVWPANEGELLLIHADGGCENRGMLRQLLANAYPDASVSVADGAPEKEEQGFVRHVYRVTAG